MGKTKYNDRTYLKRTAALKRHVKRTGEPCWICLKKEPNGEPFDWNLPSTHAKSFTADHIKAIGNGGRLLGELRPAHRGCNSSRGKKRTAEEITPPTTTRNW